MRIGELMLEIAHLFRRFGEHVAVNDVSFDVVPGALTGFVGGNGAGKTTTMRMIMGVLATHGGEVRWRGRPVTVADRRSFGYMPEERGLYPKQAVIDQLVYLARLRGVRTADAGRRAGELLRRFDLAERGKDKLESLSLGNQQRVQIAAAVIAEPAVLILDEPFSGLDPGAVDSMAALLREYAVRGVPVLFSSHQLDLVERLCDQLVILSAGRVVGRGSVADLRAGGRTRYRLVLGGDTGWLGGFAGVRVLEANGAAALVELAGASTDDLLTEALARGSVRELAEVHQSVSDIYREVTA
ncbi:ATP-binding cassette domain-containing protein [Nocardia sp. NPDC005366]|uniref:ABC transporter ATP-binding protein n=1 Tax=Nocardia sp. NPDC005366 TaxID=3156878 RepID=UPI0033AC00DB